MYKDNKIKIHKGTKVSKRTLANIVTLIGLPLIILFVNGIDLAQASRNLIPTPLNPSKNLIKSNLLLTNVIQDGSFELDSPNPFWSEVSVFGFVICNPDTCSDGINYAHTGIAWAWFGGTTVSDFAQVSQVITFTDKQAVLSFWLTIPEARRTNPAQDFLMVTMDNDFLLFVGADEAANYSNYTKIRLDVSRYADGEPHTLAFSAAINGGTTINDITSFFVDDVGLETKVYLPLILRF